MTDAPESVLRLCLVGELRVQHGETVHRSTELGSRKARTVLALLAAERERVRPAREIAEVLWPDGAPTSAEATVASLVSRLRHTVGAEVIVGGRRGYRLGRLPHVAVDLDEAAALVAEADRRLSAGQPALAVSSTAAALALLAGAPLADVDEADWVDGVQARHASLLRRARSAAARARLGVGEHSGATAVAEAALADDPLDEGAARTLMTALAASGEPSAALQVYADLRRRLADDLGSDPAPATAAVHAEILNGAVPTVGRGRTPASDEPGPLVGRARELGALRDAWSAAVSGTGSLLLVTGEAGAGKTRVADALARLAVDTGGAVLSARCYEAERALFLQPLVEAIAGTVRDRSPAEIVAAASRHSDSLARLVPEIGALMGAGPADRVRADVERRRAVEAVSALLCGLARDRPVLLLLDDLHNAGASTIELLHFLRTSLPTARLLVAATIRTDEGADALASLAPVATRLDVGPLAATAVRRLAVAAGQGHRADEIIQRTGGHALFVAEILRGPPDDDGVPTTLQAAVLARTARVGGTTDSVLRAGAVLGATFDPQHAAVLAGVTRAQGLSDCERALQVGLLRTAGRMYEFANDLVREVLYATTPTPTRLAHHAQAVDLLAGVPEQVAAHASAIEDWPRAARAWLLSAEGALRSFAASDAAALAGRALTAAEQAGDLELCGRALVLRGRSRDVQAAYTEALDDFTAAVDAARMTGDQRLEMIALREIAGNVPVALGHPPASAEGPLRRCLHLAQGLGDRVTEADVLGRLAVLAVTRLDFVAAIDRGAQALRVARACGEPRVLELALDANKTCFAYLGEVDRLDAVVQELEPLNRAHGDLTLLQWTIFESALVPLAAGDHAAAEARIEAALSVCRRSGYTPFEAFYVAHLAWVHRLAGDLDTALAVGADAVAAGREYRHAWWLPTAAALHAGTLLRVGRAAEAAALLQEIRPAAEVPGAQSYLGRCLGPLAEASGSLDVLQEANALLHGIALPDGSAWLGGADVYLSVARAWLQHDEPERARAALAPFLAAARRVGWRDLVQLGEEVLRTGEAS